MTAMTAHTTEIASASARFKGPCGPVGLPIISTGATASRSTIVAIISRVNRCRLRAAR